MPTTETATKPISIRNVDAQLWTLVNVEAAARQISIGEFVQTALREYIAEHGLATIKKGKK